MVSHRQLKAKEFTPPPDVDLFLLSLSLLTEVVKIFIPLYTLSSNPFHSFTASPNQSCLLNRIPYIFHRSPRPNNTSVFNSGYSTFAKPLVFEYHSNSGLGSCADNELQDDEDSENKEEG